MPVFFHYVFWFKPCHIQIEALKLGGGAGGGHGEGLMQGLQPVVRKIFLGGTQKR